MVQDWITRAAQEIAEEFPKTRLVHDGEVNGRVYWDEMKEECSPEKIEKVVAIIAKHAPPIVAHGDIRMGDLVMRVPRCDTCKYWAPNNGACTIIEIDAPKGPRRSLFLITTADFGCIRWKAKPPTRLCTQKLSACAVR